MTGFKRDRGGHGPLPPPPRIRSCPGRIRTIYRCLCEVCVDIGVQELGRMAKRIRDAHEYPSYLSSVSILSPKISTRVLNFKYQLTMTSLVGVQFGNILVSVMNFVSFFHLCQDFFICKYTKQFKISHTK